MRLEHLGSNRSVLKFADNFADTLHILFAYDVPVACYQFGVGYFVTTAYYNRATDRYIKAWLDGVRPHYCSQEQLDSLCTVTLPARALGLP